MKLVIDRKVWLRGEGDAVSRLLRPEDQKMCCVGIYGKALGLPDKVLEDVTTATGWGGTTVWPDWVLEECHTLGKTTDIAEVYVTNDEMDFNDRERETRLTLLFAKHGVEVEFIN